jgi:hypothetical protein
MMIDQDVIGSSEKFIEIAHRYHRLGHAGGSNRAEMSIESGLFESPRHAENVIANGIAFNYIGGNNRDSHMKANWGDTKEARNTQSQ